MLLRCYGSPAANLNRVLLNRLHTGSASRPGAHSPFLVFSAGVSVLISSLKATYTYPMSTTFATTAATPPDTNELLKMLLHPKNATSGARIIIAVKNINFLRTCLSKPISLHRAMLTLVTLRVSIFFSSENRPFPTTRSLTVVCLPSCCTVLCPSLLTAPVPRSFRPPFLPLVPLASQFWLIHVVHQTPPPPRTPAPLRKAAALARFRPPPYRRKTSAGMTPDHALPVGHVCSVVLSGQAPSAYVRRMGRGSVYI